MEIDITDFFNTCSPRDFSASVAEIGNDAGVITWTAALEQAADSAHLKTEEQKDAFREWAKGSGGWTEGEVNAWTDTELNALFIQWVSGDMREAPGITLGPETTDAEWAEYEKLQEEGVVSSNIFRGSDGRIYFGLY